MAISLTCKNIPGPPSPASTMTASISPSTSGFVWWGSNGELHTPGVENQHVFLPQRRERRSRPQARRRRPTLAGARRSTVPADCPPPLKSDPLPLPGARPLAAPRPSSSRYSHNAAAMAMDAAVSISLLPTMAGHPLARRKNSFAGSYKKKRRIPVKLVCCSADDEVKGLAPLGDNLHML
ncbi:hypothetical protein BRADI_4g09255v3 [Brachypodium distachyon]|uniref:Uncharacterized protein n=1 Tax=Brachypodium distachyon TaxID=15368 RepID=A0A0Q3HFF8_BRADI|nr:hypothetical protein BRADI_4g09255v3 [Brachypodium distachyon]